MWADPSTDASSLYYYQDIYQQKLLIKNAEIRALQSQMDPHFLFNVLNTIAWKAQMIDNEEIYEMVISLGSLMKMNTLSRNHNFTSISKEMEYVRLYVYLQQMRFEDKISCDIQIPEQALSCEILPFHSATCGKCNCPRSGTQERKRSSDHPDHRGR